jgi:hypothetical protein
MAWGARDRLATIAIARSRSTRRPLGERSRQHACAEMADAGCRSRTRWVTPGPRCQRRRRRSTTIRPRLTGSWRLGGRSAASSVTQAPAPGGPSAGCSSHKCRLAPHASVRFDPTVALDPGPSVKTRTGRRFAGWRRTSTRTCFPLAAVLTTPGESRVAARSHKRGLAIADGAVASTPEPGAGAGRPGR